VQRGNWMAGDLEDFLINTFALAEQDPAGLAFFPQNSWKWNGFSMEEIRAYVESGPDPCAYFLGILRNSAPWLTLILSVVEKKIRLITTVEYLARFDVPVAGMPSSPKDLSTVCEAIHAHIAPIRVALICDYLFFTRLLTSEDKLRDLAAAMEDGSASSFGIVEQTMGAPPPPEEIG
jgi:hypothetical protein